MLSDPYSEDVRRLFAEPKHAGSVTDGLVVRRQGQDADIELSARLDDQIIGKMAFRAYGCPHLLAACEAVCETVQGQALRVLADFDIRDLQDQLQVPVEKTGRMLLLEDTIMALNSALCGRNV